jgi:hypothetical protein
MFHDILNDESNHWNPMSANPIIPETQQENVNVEEEEEDAHVDVFHDKSYREDEEVQEVSPSIANKKRKTRVVLDIPKKAKSSTRLSFKIKLQITNIADSAFLLYQRKKVKLQSRKLWTLFWSAGADYGTNENFICRGLVPRVLRPVGYGLTNLDMT